MGRTAGKNVLHTTLVQLPNYVLFFVTGIFMTRLLGPEGKGVYSIFNASTELVILIFGFGINIGIVYFTSANRIRIRRLYAIALSTVLICTLLCLSAVLALLAGGHLELFFPKGYESLYYIGFLTGNVCLTFYNAIHRDVFRGMKSFRLINNMSLFVSGLNTLCFGAFFLLLGDRGLTIPRFMLLILAVTLVASLLWSILSAKKIGKMPSFNNRDGQLFRDVKRLLLFNSAIYFANLIQALNYRLDLWIVAYYKDNAALGAYALAGNLSQALLFITTPIASVLFPYFSDTQDEHTKQQRLKFYSKLNFTTVLLMSTGAVVLGPLLIPLLYGSGFNASVYPFLILIPGTLCLAFSKLFSSYIVSCNKTIYNIIAASSGLIVTVSLDLALIPYYGINGAAVASSIAYCLTTLLVFLFSITRIKLAMTNYFILGLDDIRQLLNKYRQD